VFCRGRRVRSGTWWLLGPKREDLPKTLRYPRFLKLLVELVKDCRERYGCEPVIAYELVNFSTGTISAQTHGGLRAMIHVVSFQATTPLTLIPVPVGTWKRLSVGNGSAKRKEYVAVMNELCGLMMIQKDEDQAAAIGVGLTALLQVFHDEQAAPKTTRRRRKS
jgi:Holliday junction resolvasome RuvABC endonuclease subunit